MVRYLHFLCIVAAIALCRLHVALSRNTRIRDRAAIGVNLANLRSRLHQLRIAPPRRSLDSDEEFGFEEDERKEGVDTGPPLYQGGRVMTSDPINVYVILYGNWPVGRARPLATFLNSLTRGDDPSADGSEPTVAGWWKISTRYYDANGSYVSPQVQ